MQNRRFILKGKVLFLMIILTLMLCGCGSNPYIHAMNQSNYVTNLQKNNTKYDGMTATEITQAKALAALKLAKIYMPYVCIISILFGIILRALVKYEAQIRRKALFIFILGIPFLYITGVYIFAALISGFII